MILLLALGIDIARVYENSAGRGHWHVGPPALHMRVEMICIWN